MSPTMTSVPVQPPKIEKTSNVLAPRSQVLEFGGVPGALFIIIAVPVTMYWFVFGCNESLGCALTMPASSWTAFREYSERVFVESFLDVTAWKIYYAWYAFCVAAWFLIPGPWVQGLPLRTGNRLEYKINALNTFAVSIGAVCTYIIIKNAKAFTILYDHWPGLLSASVVNAVVQACYVYAASFWGPKLLALGGNSGNPIFDWFIGRELNPRIGKFDIKTFNELRPGLILWVLLNISCACRQYKTYGTVTDSMILVNVFQLWYVVDALIHEPIIFSQMDITTDGFGFMLSIGDLSWVPFTYSLQARFLAFTPVQLGIAGVILVTAVQLIGFYIFRTSNVEKNDFRSGRNPKSA